MEGRCTTLATLKPDVQNWFVKALVAEKTLIHSSKWGKQQRLVLIDSENERMQCIIYEQDVDRLDQVLKLYNTYFIGNGKIKEMAASAPILASSRYQIILTRSTYIKPTSKQQELSLEHVYQLTPFADCPQFADSRAQHINLLCGVVHVFPPRFIQKINKTVQEFIVVNEECRPTILTLWEDFMQAEGRHLIENIHNMPIILGMRLSVNTYHGISIGTLPSSTILFHPPIPEAKQLDSWLKANTEYVERIVSEKLYEKQHQPIDRPLDSQIRKISQISNLLEQVKSFWIKSTIQVIKPGQHFYFLGCPTCSKPCGGVYECSFTCLYCNNEFPSPKPILRFDAELYDGTGCLDAVVEQREAQMLLDMSGEDMIKAELEENKLSLDDVNNKFKNVLFFFHIRTSNTELGGRKYTRNTITTCLEVVEQPSTPQTSKEKGSLLGTQKRALSDISMFESQQSTSTFEEKFLRTDLAEHQQPSAAKTPHKHVKQS